MKHKILVRAAMVISWLILGGCATNLYEPMIKKFAESHEASQKIINDRASILPHVARVRMLEAQYPANFDGPVGEIQGLINIDDKDQKPLLGFAEFVCNQIDALHAQKQALDDNKIYADQLKRIATAPDQDVPALTRSIVDNWKAIPGLAPVQRPKQYADCVTEVTNLVALPVSISLKL